MGLPARNLEPPVTLECLREQIAVQDGMLAFLTKWSETVSDRFGIPWPPEGWQTTRREHMTEAKKATPASKIEVPEVSKKAAQNKGASAEQMDTLISLLGDKLDEMNSKSASQARAIGQQTELVATSAIVNSTSADLLTGLVLNPVDHPEIYVVARDVVSVLGKTVTTVFVYLGVKYLIRAAGGETLVEMLP